MPAQVPANRAELTKIFGTGGSFLGLGGCLDLPPGPLTHRTPAVRERGRLLPRKDSVSGGEGVEDLDAAVGEVVGVAGGDGEAVRPGNGGDLTIQDGERAPDLFAPSHHFAIPMGRRFVEGQNPAGEALDEDSLEAFFQGAPAFARGGLRIRDAWVRGARAERAPGQPLGRGRRPSETDHPCVPGARRLASGSSGDNSFLVFGP
jgi:hypothetical protein